MVGAGQESPTGVAAWILQWQACRHVLAALGRGVLERRKTRMAFAPSPQPDDPATKDVLLRPQVLRPADRHILLGVSHASNDPALHRSFEIRATYDLSTHGWVAHVAEQNLNEQRGDWAPVRW